MSTQIGSEFIFRETRLTDLSEIEAIASRYALRVPAGLTSAVADPSQKLFTALNPNGVVIGFLRFKALPATSVETPVEWTDLVVNPNFLKHEFKLAVLAKAKSAGLTVTTAPGLISGPWKSFVKDQAGTLGYRVEEAQPKGAKSLVLRF